MLGNIIYGIAFVLAILFVIYRHSEAKRLNIRGFGRGFKTFIGFMVIVGIGAGIANAVSPGWNDDSDDDSASQPRTHKVAKKQAVKAPANVSQNIPGQKINPAKATKHEFYWTSKSDHKVRYFVDDSKKITAIKVVLTPDINNTWWCQSYLENVLHDDKLRFGNDKEKQGDGVLSNKESYNLYSPKHKKWYWVRFDAADNIGKKKDMVASFAIYPGKSSEAI